MATMAGDTYQFHGSTPPLHYSTHHWNKVKDKEWPYKTSAYHKIMTERNIEDVFSFDVCAIPPCWALTLSLLVSSSLSIDNAFFH